MIAEYQEPKGLPRDAAPLGAFTAAVTSREDAERGSRKLRDAILQSMGLDVPAPPKPVKLMTRNDVHTPTRCPCCNSPVKINHRFIAHIQATVAAYYEVPLQSMTSAQRYGKVSHPRQIAMFLADELSGKSLSEIGRRFRRDHTTVIYAIKAVKARIETDPSIELDVELLRERLRG